LLCFFSFVSLNFYYAFHISLIFYVSICSFDSNLFLIINFYIFFITIFYFLILFHFQSLYFFLFLFCFPRLNPLRGTLRWKSLMFTLGLQAGEHNRTMVECSKC
jgi:hypothetical protein